MAIHVLLMNITKLDAAKSQLATAIRLYFEDCDPVSVHTLALAASEIIDRLCVSKDTPAMRSSFLAAIIPGRRKEFADTFNKARNFFKHASPSKPNEILEDFSDEQNLIGIIMAADGLRLMGIEMLEARIFTAWVSVMEPVLMLVPPPRNCSPSSPPSTTILGRRKRKLGATCCASRAWAYRLPDAAEDPL
jgi:hypothetical protein